MRNLEIHFKTLTPLWTGGVDRSCDRVHETGIIGCLRWWYEAIVRGVGGKACDPTDHQCKLDEKKFKKPKTKEAKEWRQALLEANVCDACQAYGATGWTQRYRLHLRGGESVNFSGTLRITPRRRRRGWFLGAGLWGTLCGEVIARPQFVPASLVVPLALAELWGGLGSRTQHGYGVIRAKVLKANKPIHVDQAMLQSLPDGIRTDDQGMPSLRNMFFTRVTLQTSSIRWWRDVEGLRNLNYRDENKLRAWLSTGSVPVSPAIRNQIRFEDGLGLQDAGQKNFIFGSSDRVCKACHHKVTGRSEPFQCPMCGNVRESETLERTKTKIHVSAAYPLEEAQGVWQVRIWGWIPHTLPSGVKLNRDTILQRLHDLLGNEAMWHAALGTDIAFNGMEWREFASTRDKKTGEGTDALAFLHSLLIEEG